MNPLGLFVIPNSNYNKNDLMAHISAAKYRTCSVMDDLNLANQIRNIVPYTVYRQFGFEPQYTPDPVVRKAYVQSVMSHINEVAQGMYFMVNCEQSFSIQRLQLYIEMIDELLNKSTNGIAPFGLVFGNWASGSIRCGQGDDPNDWILIGLPFLRKLLDTHDLKLANGQPALIIGLHEYTTQYAWIVSDGGNYRMSPDWGSRPLKLDWSLPQWHIGRNIQGLEAAYRVLNTSLRIPIIITECLFDDMQDIPGHYRHFRSLRYLWAGWYPGKSLHQVLANMHIWTWETAYAPSRYVIGTHTFCAGGNADWIGFDVLSD